MTTNTFLRRKLIGFSFLAPAGRSAKKSGSPYREQGAVVNPSFDEILAFTTSYVPKVVREQYEAGLRNLYKK
ncbi:MAG: hypothetical protein AABW53_00435 [Nanoarchaeota archaeon]